MDDIARLAATYWFVVIPIMAIFAFRQRSVLLSVLVILAIAFYFRERLLPFING